MFFAGHLPSRMRARIAHDAARTRDPADAAGGVRVRPAGGVGRRGRRRSQAQAHRQGRAPGAGAARRARAGTQASLR